MSHRHLLVTNDFPPKIGGIQNYLWELWRRLDPELVAVYTTPNRDDQLFDTEQAFRIARSPEPVLLPYPWLARRIDREAERMGADLVLLDPALPLGLVGPRLSHPYGVILHGAEAAIPARVPGLRGLLGSVLSGARLIVSAGNYALDEAGSALGELPPSVVVPPGVDHERFAPPDDVAHRRALRKRWGLTDDDRAVAVVTRLVPRKGIDVLVQAVALANERWPDHLPGQLCLLIGGDGRHRREIQRQIDRSGVDGRLLGSLADDDVADLYRAADVMAMPCQRRWHGLEQEGFGIVFLEASASGCPPLAGASGGAAEAVEHGRSGFVIDPADDIEMLAGRLLQLATNEGLRLELGAAARQRAIDHFGYDTLAASLQQAIDELDLSADSAGMVSPR